MKYTHFVRSDIEQTCPAILQEWDEWLRSHFDPGHYDTWKVKDPAVKPYIDGKPQWITETFMPPHLVERMGRICPLVTTGERQIGDC